MHISLKDSILPKPPSYEQKTAYEIHRELGNGAFGKVMVGQRSDSVQIRPDSMISSPLPGIPHSVHAASDVARPSQHGSCIGEWCIDRYRRLFVCARLFGHFQIL